MSTVAAHLTLSDLFISPNFGTTDRYCVINKRDSLDEVEYGLGVERGWLLSLLSGEDKNSDLIWADMNEEVYELIHTSKMALLPERHILDKIGALLKYNYHCPVGERTPFFEVLPFTEYVYTVLPPVFPPARTLYIKGTDGSPVNDPLVNAIRSRLHPCLLLHRTMRFATRLIPFPETLNVVDEETFRVLANSSRDGYGLVQKSWLGDEKDKWKYCWRPTVYYCQDMPPTRLDAKGDDVSPGGIKQSIEEGSSNT